MTGLKCMFLVRRSRVISKGTVRRDPPWGRVIRDATGSTQRRKCPSLTFRAETIPWKWSVSPALLPTLVTTFGWDSFQVWGDKERKSHRHLQSRSTTRSPGFETVYSISLFYSYESIRVFVVWDSFPSHLYILSVRRASQTQPWA